MSYAVTIEEVMLTMAISSLVLGLMGWGMSKTSLRYSELAVFSSLFSCILAIFTITAFIFKVVGIFLSEWFY